MLAWHIIATNVVIAKAASPSGAGLAGVHERFSVDASTTAPLRCRLIGGVVSTNDASGARRRTGLCKSDRCVAATHDERLQSGDERSPLVARSHSRWRG